MPFPRKRHCSDVQATTDCPRKKAKTDNVKSYASIRAWLLSNYEISEDYSTTSDDLLNHAREDKENHGNVSYNILSSSVKTAFNDRIKCVRVRRNKKQIRLYQDLKRKHVQIGNNKDLEEEWNGLYANAETITATEGGGKWCVSKEGFSLSFIRLEDLRYDEQRVLKEITFWIDKEKRVIDVKINVHQRSIAKDVLDSVLSHMNMCSFIEKAKTLIEWLDKSEMCHGFEIKETDELYQVPIRRHTIVDIGNAAVSKRRGFSLECQVLTNSSKEQCNNCYKTKQCVDARNRRHVSKLYVHAATKTNHRYMTKEEIVQKLEKEKEKYLREKRLREKFERELLEMEENDHADLLTVMNQVSKKDIPDDMMLLWEEQKKILSTTSKSGYRWHPRIMKLCVELYSKNPHVLDPLRELIYLPSNRTIRRFKNKVDQRPGWQPDILKWCLEEAKANNLKEQEYWGGFIIDEMKIQEDIEMVVKGGKHKIVGFVDLGQIHEDMETITGKSDEPKLASHVLQIIFLGDSGFRFPIAQFPSGGCTASSLHFIFWEGVRNMLETGFTVYYCILDGAEVNRQFIKLHFADESNAIERKFVCPNPYNGRCPMVFLMDPKHNFKKLRNNISKSSLDGNTTKCLTSEDQKYILWEHLKNAFHYDQREFSFSLHEKLTADHFDLNPASKMRNHLAEEVLDKKMLSLMKAYKEHLRKVGQDGGCMLDATIELLGHSSKLIQLFQDKYAITSINDQRLKELNDFLLFLTRWKSSAGRDAKKFISPKLYFDFQSMGYGFQAIVSIKTKFFPNARVKPAIINQDVVENHFCQVRACNGQNNNPTWRLQEMSQNAIRFGQTTISRKSNAGAASLKKNINR